MFKYPVIRSCKAFIALVGVMLLSDPSSASADYLLGKQLSIQVFDPNLSTPIGPLQTFTANGTNNVNLSGGTIVNVDLIVYDTAIEFIYKQSAPFDIATFNGYVIKAISPDIPAFTSLTVDPATTLAGFGQSRISFTSTEIDLNVSALFANVGTVLKLDLVVASAVPEPASIVMLGLGVISVGGFAHRGRRTGYMWRR